MGTLLVLIVWLATTSAEAAPDPDLLGSPDPAVRKAARADIVAAGETYVPRLIEILRGEKTVAALGAAACLGEIGVSEARPPLYEALRNGSAPLREAAAAAIARMGDFRDVKPLAEALPVIPGAAARALGRLGEKKGIEPLRKALPVLTGASRIEALASLVVLGEREHIGDLVALVGAAGYPQVRVLTRLRETTGVDAGRDAAAWRTWWRRQRLGDRLETPGHEVIETILAEAETIPTSVRTKLVDDLLVLAADADERIGARTHAILLLGLMKEARSFETLLAVFEGPGGVQRAYAAEALGRLGDPRAVMPLVLKLLDAEDPDRAFGRRLYSGPRPYYVVDVEICKALVRLGIRGGLRIAIDNLFGEWWIRHYYESLLLLRNTTGQEIPFHPDASREERHAAAADWLRWFRAHRREIEVPAPFPHDDPRLQAEITKAIERMGLYKFLTSDTARRALMIIGEPARLPVERALSSHPNAFVRTYAADILGEIGDPASVPVLAASLEKDLDSGVRAICAEALGRIGPVAGRRALDALRSAILSGDETADVQIQAVEALGLISDLPFDAAILADILDESKAYGRPFALAAARAMLRIGSPDGGPHALRFLASEDESERRRAVAVLREVTGHDLGFDPEGSAEARKAAVERWRARIERPGAILPRAARGYVRVTALTNR